MSEQQEEIGAYTQFAITIKDCTAAACGVPIDEIKETFVFDLPQEAIQLLKKYSPMNGYTSVALTLISKCTDAPAKDKDVT